MLKTRIIGVVLVKAGIVVQSIGFNRYLPIGIPEVAISYLDRWGIDEIVVLHLDATLNRFCITEAQVKSYAKHCHVPLSIGGGIKKVDDIKRIIRSGADKVVINSSLVSYPHLISEGAELFGEQSIIASLDVRKISPQQWMTFTHSGKKSTEKNVSDLAKQFNNIGAGEILLTSIDKDGSKDGYDLDLICTVNKAVNMPIIACGGAGNPSHLQDAIQAGASAVAVGNYFHFTEHSVTITKQYLKAHAMPIRLDGYFSYENKVFNSDGRITKYKDAVLETMRFEYIPVEEI